eukprot:g575.t1
MGDSPITLIRRDCASCSATSRTIFYKRLTALPSYDLLSVLKSNWTLAPGNAFNVDFELYSTLDDALSGDSSKRWAYCNGDDPSGVGAFRDCSPSTKIDNTNQWNSFSGRGGQADILFAVANTAKPGPPAPLPPPPTPAPGSFPGPENLHPKIHFTPHYVSQQGGWHDVAGAITHNGVHHIYQGTGWNHAFSKDLVHWQTGVHGPAAIEETYAGMDSLSDPCSGFVTKDPLDTSMGQSKGRVCAGFRQCGSRKGVDGGASWDVPLELRCALNDELTAWANTTADIDYLFNVSWWRGIPYDPARPWFEESDSQWYQLLSMDGCNETTKALPCEAGGELVMWKSPALRGPTAAWEKVGPVFNAKDAILAGSHLTKEFVTIDYIGSTDPKDGETRYFLNNVGGNGGGEGCCSGTTSYFPVTQAAGQPMKQVGPQSMLDWGAFVLSDESKTGLDALIGTGSRGLSMARTLGSEEADQVTKPGRRVLIGWTGPSPLAALGGQGSAQSLARDLSAGADGKTLLQAFAPELQALRDERLAPASPGAAVSAGLQAEVLARFDGNKGGSLSVMGDDEGATVITLDTARQLVIVNATSQGNNQSSAAATLDVWTLKTANENL